MSPHSGRRAEEGRDPAPQTGSRLGRRRHGPHGRSARPHRPAALPSVHSPAPTGLLHVAACAADALAVRWLSGRLAAASPADLVQRIEARAYGLGFDDGFQRGAVLGCAMGRRLEALRSAAELERWRRLVRWTALQRGTA
jgi:hypothetical protein